MKLFTIGFTKKSARRFFSLLRDSGARHLLDVRVNRSSQLAGFAKQDDLEFFLSEICQLDYRHEPLLTPTAPMLAAYRGKQRSWTEYEREFVELLASRQVEKSVERSGLDGACLLCSEHEPEQCHRRLAAEYLQRCWGDLEIVHLI